MTTQERTMPTNDEIMERLRTVEDPELRMSIVDLGLVYDVTPRPDGTVRILMTLTSPGCPLGPVIGGQAYAALIDLPGVEDVDVEITFKPPWDPRTMASEEVQMMLGIY
ncbi:MAG TPA: metal-sulfur cluster assembly factor [Dehalococcoidia bacterium]|nr:metal-sulfur cluster assembly factor [Dehalococcoidia bacterium]